MSETNSLLYSGATALDPVLRGVARGLSQLFPPIANPEDRLADDRALTDNDSADATS